MLYVGEGEDVTIKELAEIVTETVGFEGELKFDTSKPDDTPRKLLDVSKLNQTGWQADIQLSEVNELNLHMNGFLKI